MILPTFITITSGDMATTIAYTADFLGDILPLFLPILGITIGVLIFWALVGILKR